jgi:DNA repair exonuclease SbcCD nuclease subunit
MTSVNRDVVVVHTSDVHVDHEYTARANNGDGARPLAVVLNAARDVGADAILLCGDTFDCHNIPVELVQRVSRMLRDAGLPVVLLPGNHDPAIEDAIWTPGGLTAVENLHILGVTHDEALVLDHLDLEIWGRPHRDYGDMIPLETVPERRARWRIDMAHGHYDPVPDRSKRPRASWLIGDDEITATGADYLALGHWNRAIKVGTGPVPAYYSGSPDYAQTVNVVRFRSSGEFEVDRHPLDWS